MAESVDTKDIQSLVFSGHGRLRHAVAAWLTADDRQTAKIALQDLVETRVAFGIGRDPNVPAVQILFSSAGVKALDAGRDRLQSLSRPFQQGIVSPQRSRALGDAEQNDPQNWLWRDSNSHALIFVYAIYEDAARSECNRLLQGLAPAWKIERICSIRQPTDFREPFGFRDGLSSTRVDIGNGKSPPPGVALLPPGEIVLGYHTAAGTLARPSAFARNGSYAVVRQLDQDVEGFWRFWLSRGADEKEAIWLASKAVGRWPNGMPISGSIPIDEPLYDEKIAKGKLSFKDDLHGDRCPLGAHIRRANPRDGMRIDPELSLELISHRRLMRRGRVYGPEPDPAWYPQKMRLNTKHSSVNDTPDTNPGLLFICLCADITRQFEFVQQTWLNNPKHADLYDEVDPITAGQGIIGESKRFSIPRAPFRLRISDVRRWVTVRGGGYYFLPGRQALHDFLSE